MYSGDMTFAQWATQAENQRLQLQQRIDEALHAYAKWYDYAYGKTDAQIAAALGKTEADVAKMQAAYGAFKTVHDIIYGQAALANPYDFNGAWAAF